MAHLSPRPVTALLVLLSAACSSAFSLSAGAAAQHRVARRITIAACDTAPAEPAADAAEAASASPQIVSFSENAFAQLESMREKQGLDEIVLRMGVRAGGCSGMSYVMDLTKQEDIADDDTIVEFAENKIRCAIDPKSLMFLYGMQLDYSDELIGGGFSFMNPNAEETCGCGKSFGI